MEKKDLIKNSDGWTDLLERILEGFPGSVMAFDSETKVIYANQMTTQMLGVELDDLWGRDFSEEKELFSPSAVMEAKSTGRAAWIRSENQKKEGMSISAIPFLDENGQVQEVYTFIQEEKIIEAFVDWILYKREEVISFLNEKTTRDIPDPSVIASSRAMTEVLQMARRIAPTTGVVMIYGESGTGKEVLAHYIHANSGQKEGLFFPVNCAAVPEELAESEFFGYEAGAFTGSKKNGKAGYFELAGGGTLFLDEIGELSLSLQAKLLRVIETKQVMRVGGDRPIDISARILCATHRDLKEMVKEGKFREDLYYRLNVLPLYIPPLRERKEDILPMAFRFLNEFNRKNGTDKVFANKLCQQMEEYHWPGNVRELKNIIERAVIISPYHIIDSEIIFPAVIVKEEAKVESVCSQPIVPLKEAVKNAERSYLERVLRQLNWDVQEASKILEVHPSGLYKKIKEYRLKKPETEE